MARTAKPTPTRAARGGAARPGGEFFARPTGPNHRRYEALRGYLYEGLPIEAAAARAGYSVATLRSAVRDFRAGKTGFFANPARDPPGRRPRTPPGPGSSSCAGPGTRPPRSPRRWPARPPR